jgi:hypothetical protein
MRLTLRTLLAYLNQSNLNLRAIERIEAKVRSSPAAARLIDEIRRITTDPEIAALAPDCDEGKKNANWVAEYLDNSLPEGEVEGFEKQAFESTLLLSEIAGCHEILSAITRQETANAPAALRQRAYEIGRAPLDQAGLPDVSEIEYLGSASRNSARGTLSSHQFVDEFKRAEVEFRLGPPPEESQRHDEWADAISSEGFEFLHNRQISWAVSIGLLTLALILLGMSIWLLMRAGGGTQ